ncbi:DUF2993 domain-containing protein [Synechocystis sp. LKSZ1]|uniref:LmeA family phospholipid-binding protein n=1 Tax=Synechocystis sp. LKSZ1 TaxID=3144951 RepID=UPI00336BBEF9
MSTDVSHGLITKILTPALRLWLQSQLEAVESLEIDIQGQNRQILKGYVPRVALQSRQALYQGLSLGRVLLKGENIRINIGQIVKGKPLQLLEPIQVSGEVQISQADLQASLPSAILSNALTELLLALLERLDIADPQAYLADYQLQWQSIVLAEQSFTLSADLTTAQETHYLKLRAHLSLLNPQALHLDNLELQGLPGLANSKLGPLTVDLGEDVSLEALNLSPAELSCLGRLLIRP